MYNKRICILLATTLIILLAGITAISAADPDDNQVVTSSLSDNTQTLEKTQELSTTNDNDVATDKDNAIKSQLKTTKKIETENYVNKDKSIKTTDNTVKTTDKTTTKEDTTKTENKTTNNVKTLKTEESTTITVTDGNYGKYFNQEGTTNINPNTTVILSGTFNNRLFCLDQPNTNLVGNNATLYNGSINIFDSAANTTVSNLTIYIDNADGVESAIYNDASDILIKNNNITFIKNEGPTQGITNVADNVHIINNTVTVYGPGIDIDWTGGDREGLADTFAIFNWGGNNVLIENNTAKSYKSKDSVENYFGTIDGIEVHEGTNITINNNDVYVTGVRFVYGINALQNIQHVYITNNRINVSGDRYIDGIQIGNSAEHCSLINNTIIGECYNTTIFTEDNEALAFGIITTSMGGSESKNMTVEGNKINMNATIVYGMEIYTTSNTTIKNNTVQAVGNYSMGMSLAHSPNSNITNNYFETYGNSNIKINPIVEEISPANTGIQLQQNSTNVYIANNTVVTMDEGNNAMSVNIERTNDITVTDNTLKANTKTGNDAVTATEGLVNVTITDNHSPVEKHDAIITVTTQKTTATGTALNVNIKVVDKETGKLLNGKATIKLNGKTILDDNGPVIFKVVNGVANYSYVLKNIGAKDVTVTAIFSGNNYNTARNNTIVTVTKTNVILPSQTITTYADKLITINQTLRDSNNNPIYGNTTVAIKVNGYTVKNVNISNGVLLTSFEVPSKYLKSGNNVLTIVLGENYRYNGISVNNNLNILPEKPVITINKITAKPGEYVELTATIVSNVTKTPINGGKYSFKINGNTIKPVDKTTYEIINTTTQVLENGVAKIGTYIDVSANNGVYNITVTYSGNTYILEGRVTNSSLIIKA